MNILLVDDDPNILKLMSRMLEHRGHQVQICSTPFGVSAQIMRQPPDVVVLDVMMPGLGGPQLAGLITKLELPRQPAILIWSAMQEDDLQRIGHEMGGIPTISKSVPLASIAVTIERMVTREET